MKSLFYGNYFFIIKYLLIINVVKSNEANSVNSKNHSEILRRLGFNPTPNITPKPAQNQLDVNQFCLTGYLL